MKLLVALCLLFPASAPALAGCAPEKMVKIVLRDATPGVDPDSFAAKPKTIYRLGSKYTRTEEAVAADASSPAGLAMVAEGLLLENSAFRWKFT